MTDPIDLNGFTGWVSVADWGSAPTDPGVYVVVRSIDTPPYFVDVAPYRGDPPMSIAELEERWVPGARIVYVGKAGRGTKNGGLRRRLRQLARYGAGQAARHSGGRAIWQLDDRDDLLVGWCVTDDSQARQVEKDMIAAFRAHYGVRPFANDAD